MVMSTDMIAMNRAKNLFALQLILNSMSTLNSDSFTLTKLRRAVYLHGIVEAVLIEQVSSLPQTIEIFS